MLRQELKHAASTRQTSVVKLSAEAQVTDAEKIVIAALASAGVWPTESPVSDRSGSDEAFDPARQARYVLASQRLHQGLATESLIDALLNSPEPVEVMDLPIGDDERRLLAAILMKDEGELGPDKIEGAVKALVRLQLRRRLEQIQKQLESSPDPLRIRALMEKKLSLKRALMDRNTTWQEATSLLAEPGDAFTT